MHSLVLQTCNVLPQHNSSKYRRVVVVVRIPLYMDPTQPITQAISPYIHTLCTQQVPYRLQQGSMSQ
jgi:hypothetical protein